MSKTIISNSDRFFATLVKKIYCNNSLKANCFFYNPYKYEENLSCRFCLACDSVTQVQTCSCGCGCCGFVNRPHATADFSTRPHPAAKFSTRPPAPADFKPARTRPLARRDPQQPAGPQFFVTSKSEFSIILIFRNL